MVLDSLERRSMLSAGGISADLADAGSVVAPLTLETTAGSSDTDEVAGKTPCPCCGGSIHGALSAASIDDAGEATAARATQHTSDRRWTSLDAIPAARNPNTQSYIRAENFAAYQLDESSIAAQLRNAPREFTAAARNAPLEISVPTPDGRLARFHVVETIEMEEGLRAQFPTYKTYSGIGVDDPTQNIRISSTALGFSASVLGAGNSFYVDRYYHLQDGLYASYYRRDAAAPSVEPMCLTDAEPSGETEGPAVELVPTGTTLRTYRLAIAATGEYTQFHGGTAALGQAAIVNTVTRLNQVYEAELTIRFTLVANNINLVFTNPATDPYSNTANSTQLNINQSQTDTIIGAANYDIGHLYTTEPFSGLAGVSVVGINGQKARGISGLSSPIGDPFVVDFVAHEMGHQFGALHTFANCGGGLDGGTTQMEPGSGSTIMAYAGLCGSGFDLQPNSDPDFHSISYDQIINHVDSVIPGVGTRTATGNTPPTVNAGPNYTIPTGTPYALTATGSDANGDVVSYDWEQRDDASSAVTTNNFTGTTGPQVRSIVASTNPTRTVPRLSSLVNNTFTIGEVYSNVARTLNFRVTAKDNRIGGGGLNSDDMVLTVVNTGSAFSVTSFNSGVNQLPEGSTQTINWNVAGTTGSGINTANVRILMSTNGGLTYPIELVASTPNDGSESFTVPTGLTTTARFRVEAVGNIFFDINNVNVQIVAGGTVSATPGTPDLQPASDTGVSNTDNITRLNNSSGGAVLTFDIPGTVAGATVQLFDGANVIGTAVATGTTTTITTNGTLSIPNGVRSITARQTEPGKTISPNGGALSTQVDTIPPIANAFVAFNRLIGPHQIQISFTENMNGGVTASSLSLTNLTSGASNGTPSVAFDTGTNTATFTFPSAPGGIGTLVNGNYSANLVQAGTTDVAGNQVSNTQASSFFFLMGDANNDRITNISDFAVMASNFNLSPRQFSQGDFNYNGTVEIGDFALLGANFNVSVPPPADLPRLASSATAIRTANPFSGSRIDAESAIDQLEEQSGILA